MSTDGVSLSRSRREPSSYRSSWIEVAVCSRIRTASGALPIETPSIHFVPCTPMPSNGSEPRYCSVTSNRSAAGARANDTRNWSPPQVTVTGAGSTSFVAGTVSVGSLRTSGPGAADWVSSVAGCWSETSCSAIRSAACSAGSPGELTPLPEATPPVCTTWATSWASRRVPAAVSSAADRSPTTMSDPVA
jgi:hypothetical protein